MVSKVVVFKSPTVNVPVELISYEEAKDRLYSWKPTFWYKKWAEKQISGDTFWYTHVGTNTNVHCSSLRVLQFPTSRPTDFQQILPSYRVQGWWFGKPATFEDQLLLGPQKLARWWVSEARIDVLKRKPLLKSLARYSEFYNGGEKEYDWAVLEKGRLEYALAWSGWQVLRMRTPAILTVGNESVVERVNGFYIGKQMRELLKKALQQQIEPVYSERLPNAQTTIEEAVEEEE